jgi:TonB family protein
VRGLILCTVVVAHVGIIGVWFGGPVEKRDTVAGGDPILAFVIPQAVERGSVPLSVVLRRLPPPELPTIADVKFEDPDVGRVPEVTATASVPRLAAVQEIDREAFARRAGLSSGSAITVVLSVEVLADGSTGRISVLFGTGNSWADAQAVDYVRGLRWVPGTVHGYATAMRIQFPVTLSSSG